MLVSKSSSEILVDAAKGSGNAIIKVCQQQQDNNHPYRGRLMSTADLPRLS
jgi:hypothetical protein